MKRRLNFFIMCLLFSSDRRQDHDNSLKDFGSEDGYLCPSSVKYARPKRARATSGQWKFIVNTGDYTQTLRLEMCQWVLPDTRRGLLRPRRGVLWLGGMTMLEKPQSLDRRGGAFASVGSQILVLQLTTSYCCRLNLAGEHFRNRNLFFGRPNKILINEAKNLDHKQR